MIVTILSAVATSIGLAQACALLDQTRKLRRAGSADEVSVAFLTASLVGNVVWFAYGAFQVDLALLAVNSAGLLGGAATLGTALRLRRRCRAAAKAYVRAREPHPVRVTARPAVSAVVSRNVPKPRRAQGVPAQKRQNCRMAPARIPATSARTVSARTQTPHDQPSRTTAVPATTIPAEAPSPVLATPHTHRWMRQMCTQVAAAVSA
ncbi:SemiSWEET family transporter [Actinopolymorpha sp. NPDC004070]|uniref:SemiSWEET family transporter n=1 Tax=Actinopolymorpha sp. NPDC004070 TaxID=3154548 RepID=UPI0033B3D820